MVTRVSLRTGESMSSLSKEQIARLESLESAGGRLTAEAVLFDAQGVTSPLHDLFDWDDASAAYKQRLDRARHIIREVLVNVTTTTTTVTVERYVPDPRISRHDGGYVALTTVQDEDTQHRIMVSEITRALGVMRRAESIAIALGLEEGANGAIERWENWRDSLTA
jgi:hypothetical protein